MKYLPLKVVVFAHRIVLSLVAVAAVSAPLACTPTASPPDAGTYTGCSSQFPSGAPCDGAGVLCANYYDGYSDHRWGAETWTCEDARIVYTDNTWVVLPTDCTTELAGAPTAVLSLTHLAVATDAGGFNLDGLNTSVPPAGSGANVAGCGVLDSAGGIEQRLGAVASALGGSVDLPASVANSLIVPNADGGLPRGAAIDLELYGLAGGAAADTSVCARLVVRSPGQEDVAITGRGSNVNNYTNLTFDSPLTASLVVDAAPTHCENASCTPAPFAFELRGVRALVLLDRLHTHALAGSTFGGFVFLGDCENGTIDPLTGACMGGTFADANSTGFGAALTAFAQATHLDPAFVASVRDAVLGARDLRMDPYGVLTACSGVDLASVNSNALSVALTFDSL